MEIALSYMKGSLLVCLSIFESLSDLTKTCSGIIITNNNLDRQNEYLSRCSRYPLIRFLFNAHTVVMQTMVDPPLNLLIIYRRRWCSKQEHMVVQDLYSASAQIQSAQASDNQ